MTPLAPAVTPLDVARIRADFPILRRLVRNKALVYLDNAATTQKPQVVLDALVHYYTDINAKRHDELVFTSRPLTKPIEVTGEMSASVWASSDAHDTLLIFDVWMEHTKVGLWAVPGTGLLASGLRARDIFADGVHVHVFTKVGVTCVPAPTASPTAAPTCAGVTSVHASVSAYASSGRAAPQQGNAASRTRREGEDATGTRCRQHQYGSWSLPPSDRGFSCRTRSRLAYHYSLQADSG